MGVRTAVLALALTPFVASAVAAGRAGGELDAQVTLTSDYVFRGISQTREEPALQAGAEFRHDSGFFAGVWASNVDFPGNELHRRPRELEVDLYLGVGRDLGRGWSASATLIRYDYSAGSPDRDYSYNEAIAGFRYFEQLSFVVAYADSALGGDEPGLTYELTARYPASRRVDISAGVGYSDLEGAFLDGYAFWNLGVSTTLWRFTLNLSAYGTDGTARQIWAEVADDRLVLSTTIAIR